MTPSCISPCLGILPKPLCQPQTKDPWTIARFCVSLRISDSGWRLRKKEAKKLKKEAKKVKKETKDTKKKAEPGGKVKKEAKKEAKSESDSSDSDSDSWWQKVVLCTTPNP